MSNIPLDVMKVIFSYFNFSQRGSASITRVRTQRVLTKDNLIIELSENIINFQLVSKHWRDCFLNFICQDIIPKFKYNAFFLPKEFLALSKNTLNIPVFSYKIPNVINLYFFEIYKKPFDINYYFFNVLSYNFTRIITPNFESFFNSKGITFFKLPNQVNNQNDLVESGKLELDKVCLEKTINIGNKKEEKIIDLFSIYKSFILKKKIHICPYCPVLIKTENVVFSPSFSIEPIESWNRDRLPTILPSFCSGPFDGCLELHPTIELDHKI